MNKDGGNSFSRLSLLREKKGEVKGKNRIGTKLLATILTIILAYTVAGKISPLFNNGAKAICDGEIKLEDTLILDRNDYTILERELEDNRSGELSPFYVDADTEEVHIDFEALNAYWQKTSPDQYMESIGEFSNPGSDELREYNKLMIVAHADDEIIWGGAHLLEDNYYVVCVSSGNIPKRVTEFTSAMIATGDKCAMLDYSVYNKNGKISYWKNEIPEITKDIEAIINLKDWDMIVTHNPNGEYGHNQHVILSKIVTDLAIKKNISLYYFGEYYKKPKETFKITADLLIAKEEILKTNYPSKYWSVMSKHGQMLPYEIWAVGYLKISMPDYILDVTSQINGNNISFSDALFRNIDDSNQNDLIDEEAEIHTKTY